MNKILSIKKQVSIESSLPDGTYSGLWSGSIIIVNYHTMVFELKTEEAVRSINI